MSSAHHNLSGFNKENAPDASSMKIGIVVSDWNEEITEALYEGAYKTLIDCKAKKENIIRVNVPGSFELPLGAQSLFLQQKVDAVICLGCVIQGETRHFEFICNAVANGLTDLSIMHKAPFVFGVLTTNNLQQAIDRAGGKHGNKGVEAALTAVKMVELQSQLTSK